MTNSRSFEDRREAGRILGGTLKQKGLRDPVILALPRGGVPVGLEVARTLKAPLDIVLVRKIGVPFQRELAAGAVVDGGHPEIVMNDDVIAVAGLTRADVEAYAKHELEEIERRRKLYLKDRKRASIVDRTAVVVDDGIATGATMRAALHALKRKKPKWLILAVPVSPQSTLDKLCAEADEIICLDVPEPFYGIGLHYRDFRQVSDDEVVTLLAEAEDIVEPTASSSPLQSASSQPENTQQTD